MKRRLRRLDRDLRAIEIGLTLIAIFFSLAFVASLIKLILILIN